LKSFSFAFFLLFPFFTFSQEVFSPLKDKPEAQMTPIQSELVIDGQLSEDEWKLAKPIYLNYQVEPFQGNQASFRTEVRLLGNKQFLYVLAINYDTIGKRNFRSPNLKRDYNFADNDLFGIAIDGFKDERNALVLQSNAYGVQRDLLSFDDRQYDVDWDGLYKVRTQRTDSSWVAEFAIPWQTLRYPKLDESKTQDWGLNFFRVRRSSNEVSVWSPHPRAFSALRMDYAGILKNISPPNSSAANIRFVPYSLVLSDQDKGSQVGNSNSSSIKFGGEIKWAINPNNILDLTINTDFAQADVDRQVNNISRFSVFFPERRQFFLENASLFGAGLAPVDEVLGGSMVIQPFFSRTIGLDQNVQPIAINGGGRFVHRSDGQNFGAILVQQAAGDGVNFTNFGVGRFSQNFGKQNRLGGILTYKQNPIQTQSTSSVDAFVRFSDVLSYSGMFSVTHDSQTGNSAIAQYNQFFYRTNQLNAYWTQTTVNKDYLPAMGFVSRNNILSNSQGGFYNLRKKWFPKWIRSIEPGIYTEFYHSLSTSKLVEGKILGSPFWANLQNGGIIGIYGESSFQNLEENFSPLGIDIAQGQYQYFRQGIMVSTDLSKKYSFQGNYDFGGFYDGHSNYYNIKFNLAPIPHVNFGITYDRNEFKAIGKQKEYKNVDLFMLESRLALNPRVQLIGFYQRNTFNDLQVLNVRFSYEYQPLSFIYLVFNQSDFLGTDATLQKQTRFLSKISFLKQF
jgi:hypothetical protein